jgi:Domain of unknown function (DUF4936)
MAFSFYIYYRVDPAKATECEPRVRELFAAMHKATGVSGQLLKKRGESNLWMEVYLGVQDDAKFEWELADVAGRLKFQELLQDGTTRHMECFEH